MINPYAVFLVCQIVVQVKDSGTFADITLDFEFKLSHFKHGEKIERGTRRWSYICTCLLAAL